VAQQRETAPLDVGKEERRTACLVDPPLDRPHFQVRINLLLNSLQHSVPLQIGDTLLQIAIPHNRPSSSQLRISTSCNALLPPPSRFTKPARLPPTPRLATLNPIAQKWRFLAIKLAIFSHKHPS